jgi:2-polyprenyl-6-methoxyphenol hydroxylase-like FAD-dependent oxidoreductase
MVGLAEKVLMGKAPLQEFRDMTSTGEVLGRSGVAATFVGRYSQPAAGVPRAELNLLLKEELLCKGIPVHEGWRLQDIEESDTGVVAVSADGQRIEGSFLVGCDGLRGKSRELLLKRKGVAQGAAAFTGLTQVCSTLARTLGFVTALMLTFTTYVARRIFAHACRVARSICHGELLRSRSACDYVSALGRTVGVRDHSA